VVRRAPAGRRTSGYARGVLPIVFLILLASFLLHRLVIGYPKPEARYAVLAPRDVAFLQAVSESMFPADAGMAVPGAEVDMPGFADRYLAGLPKRQQLLVRALFLFFEQSTLLWPARGIGAFRRFSKMSLEQRTRVLRGWNESDLYLRRLIFTALKAVLILGYVGDEDVLQSLGLTPYEIEVPVCQADLLYPAIGQLPDSIRFGPGDLTPPSDGTPLAGSRGRA
jgi:hypothetical protein